MFNIVVKLLFTLTQNTSNYFETYKHYDNYLDNNFSILLQ